MAEPFGVVALRVSSAKFAHCAQHQPKEITLLDSYHCSRYNINTGVLTVEMFVQVMAKARALMADTGD